MGRGFQALLALPRDLFPPAPKLKEASGEPAETAQQAEVVRRDKSGTRPMIHVFIEMSKVDFTLNRDNGTTLALIVVEDLTSKVDLYVSFLRVTASLGILWLTN